MLELYEEDIEDWFFHHRDKTTLTKYLCEGIVLKKESKSNIIVHFLMNLIIYF
jgi:hypothetical protein